MIQLGWIPSVAPAGAQGKESKNEIKQQSSSSQRCCQAVVAAAAVQLPYLGCCFTLALFPRTT